jgi:hypothetical protein
MLGDDHLRPYGHPQRGLRFRGLAGLPEPPRPQGRSSKRECPQWHWRPDGWPDRWKPTLANDQAISAGERRVRGGRQRWPASAGQGAGVSMWKWCGWEIILSVMH